MTITNLLTLRTEYRQFVEQFYSYLPDTIRPIFVNDALFHKERYIDLLSEPLSGHIVEAGSDKPFITHVLRTLFPEALIDTVSMDMPNSPYPIKQVDIESELLPFDAGSIDTVIFTEVLEHLFRDPSWATYQINKILRVGGTLFLTTPNACGYDALQNILDQKNPNERNQFYERIESGHPHLWTARECRILLEANGFVIRDLRTCDYYDIPKRRGTEEIISQFGAGLDLHGQTLRIVAVKGGNITEPKYPVALFPEGKPVQIIGALERWVSVKRK